MKKIIFTFFLIVHCTLLIDNCFAQWVQTSGPDGGSIRCFVKDSLNRWFIGTTGNGVYYSVNEGANWTTANTGLTYGKINGLALDSTNVFFAATERGLFRSSNSGGLWTNIFFGTNVINSVVVDANNRLFVATGSTVWLSTNSGTSFVPSGVGLSGTSYYNLTAAPNNYLYTNSSTGGIFRSMDNGANWVAVNSGLPSTSIAVINAAPNNYLFVGISNSGIYLSTNNGDNWTQVNSGLGNMFVNSIGSYGTTVFAGTNNGIYKSTNYGALWTAVNTGFSSPYVGCGSFGFASGSVVFAGTYGIGVLKSTDGGSSWYNSSSGINAASVKSLALAPNGRIFVGFTGGVYASTNNGTTFIQSDAGITNTMNNIIRVHPNGYVYAGTFPMSGTPMSGIFRSTNSGASWSPVMNGWTYQYNNILDFAFDSSGFIYCASNDNMYKSTNLGDNWFRANNGITNNQVYSLAINKQNNHIYAGTYGSGAFRSRDNGASFEQINNGLTATQIMSLEVNSSGVIFAGSNGYGVFRSTNDGDLWEQVLFYTGMQAWKVAISPSGQIYAGIVGGYLSNLGVYRSTDNGNNWTQISDGIFYPFIDALGFDAAGYAYAGSLGGGLYRSTFLTPVVNNQNTVREYKLYQNYPNPFNPKTVISYQLVVNSFSTLKIYDILGHEVATLINEQLKPGNYEVEWDGTNYPSGIYFYKLITGDYTDTKKMVLVK